MVAQECRRMFDAGQNCWLGTVEGRAVVYESSEFIFILVMDQSYLSILIYMEL